MTPQPEPSATFTIGAIQGRIQATPLERIRADAYIIPQFNSGTVPENDIDNSAIWRSGARQAFDAYDALAYRTQVEALETLGRHEEARAVPRHDGRSGNAEISLPKGSAHLTESGGGNADYIIHAVTRTPRPSLDGIREGVCNALKRAEEAGLQQVAIPLMHAGQSLYRLFEFPLDLSAAAMMAGIQEYLDQGGKPLSVTICAPSDKVEAVRIASLGSYMPLVGKAVDAQMPVPGQHRPANASLDAPYLEWLGDEQRLVALGRRPAFDHPPRTDYYAEMRARSPFADRHPKRDPLVSQGGPARGAAE